MWYFFGKYQILRINASVVNMSFIALSLLSYVTAVAFALIIETPLITMETLLWCPRKRRYLRDTLANLGDNRYESFKSAKLQRENEDNSDSGTKDSNKEVPLYPTTKIKDIKPTKLNIIRRSNSLDDEFDSNSKNPPSKTLLNESDDSKPYTSFKEPFIPSTQY